MCRDCLGGLDEREIDGIPVARGDVYVQPLFHIKEEMAECYCTNNDAYPFGAVCGGEGFHYTPTLPADRMVEVWIKTGSIAGNLDHLELLEKYIVQRLRGKVFVE